ncbi:FliI/YscN family ATPase [Alicyclobacillaceae bacterium I2511]|nr:FliI/YscN family ATPase [Alicyclobacillaceae bacterium I2511]
MQDEFFSILLQRLEQVPLFRTYGRVMKVVGLTVESQGPSARVGDVCHIRSSTEGGCYAEVMGFRGNRLVLMPLGDLSDVAPGADVVALHQPLSVACGPAMLGRVLDGLGQPMDRPDAIVADQQRPIAAPSPNPLLRRPIHRALQTGVRAVDGMLTVGEGQRMGIFSGSGVGKSTLLSMVARNTSAQINVIALIGERGREVREFIERDLGPLGLARSVVVVATSDQPALIRVKAAFVATAIAEYFRDQGQSVLLMMDSITRFAMAQREIGLAVGEPPTSRGYTPSVFALLPRLLERAGNGVTGSITAFYTVLVDGDDLNDPITDAVRGILDGHVVLSRDLANSGRFPAVDVLASLSRLFNVLTTPPQRAAATTLREWLQRYRDTEDLLRIGAYQSGNDLQTDVAIAKHKDIRLFLEQDKDAATPIEESVQWMCRLSEVVP